MGQQQPPLVIDENSSVKKDYDPFIRGRFPAGVRTIQVVDAARNRLFPCEIWYPATAQYRGEDTAETTQDVFALPSSNTTRRQTAVRNAAAEPGTYPLILYSHGSGGSRRMATFLCTHLCSHGYVVAALDHSETVAAELERREGETDEELATRTQEWIANRVPDIRVLLDHLLQSGTGHSETRVDPAQIGLVGYSFGGWTVLAAPEVEPRIRVVVALAPGGSSQPKPGIIRAKLTFAWGRDVPTLYLVGENDIFTPLSGMYELFARTPATKQLVVLHRADHMHFIDDVEQTHELVRAMHWTGAMAWVPNEIRPITELCSGEEAHVFVRALTLCQVDAVLRQREEALRFLEGDIESELAARGVRATAYRP
jgi:predicted dienelactone hydrolase